MSRFFEKLEESQNHGGTRMQFQSTLLFEAQGPIAFDIHDSCSRILAPIIHLLEGQGAHIEGFNHQITRSLLEEFLDSNYDVPNSQNRILGRKSVKVEHLPLLHLEKALRVWILILNRDVQRQLASTYALRAAEYVNFMLGQEMYDRKACHVKLFAAESLDLFWNNNFHRKFSFLWDANFKRAFSKGMNKSIMRGVVPPKAEINSYGDSILGPGEEFFFIPKRCYLSNEFDRFYSDRYFFEFFTCSLPQKPKFIDEPYLKGALIRKFEEASLDPGSKSVYLGEVPLDWFMNTVERDQSLPTGYRLTSLI